MCKFRIMVILLIIFTIVIVGTSFPISEKANVDVRNIELLYVSELVPEIVETEEIEVVEEVVVDKQYNEEDLYWLSRIISAESRGEPIKGQIAVGNVVMNRVKSDKFPNTIKEVIFQKGQFCPVRNKSIYKDPTDESIESAKRVLDGEEVIGDAIYFFDPRYTSRGNWIRTRKEVNTIGNHKFAK